MCVCVCVCVCVWVGVCVDQKDNEICESRLFLSRIFSSIFSRVKEKNPHAVLVACPCHKAHTVVGHAVKQLPVKIEDFLVDLFYFFHKRFIHDLTTVVDCTITACASTCTNLKAYLVNYC